MIVIVCGTRKVSDSCKAQVFATLRSLHDDYGLSRVVHGDCPDSPDQWAKEWCDEFHIYCEPFEADWEAFGTKAGPMRNRTMAKYVAMSPDSSRFCLAVWDGKSKGTLNMIKEAVKLGIGVEIIPATLR